MVGQSIPSFILGPVLAHCQGAISPICTCPLGEACASCCRECDEELEGTRGQQQLSFARDKAAKAAYSSGAGRHSLYRAHRLQRVVKF